jgi:hypothetical protein
MVLADTVSVWPSIPGRWISIRWKVKEGRREGSPERKKSGEGVLELDGGEPPVVGDGDGVADVMQERTASSKV